MTKICTVPATVLAVTLAAAKEALRVDGTDLDGMITRWLKGIIADVEHQIGQCLMAQSWRVILDCFPGVIALPHPVMSITSVKYLDVAGVQQTLAQSAYKLNPSAYESFLSPVAGTSWPATFAERGAVVVDLVCGFGTTPDATPANVQMYIESRLVEQFDPSNAGKIDGVQSAFLDRLLDACRVYA